MTISELLELLITKQYYKEADTIISKVNFFYAMSQITDEEYSKLMLLITNVYAPVVDEPAAEKNAEDNTLTEDAEQSKENEQKDKIESEE